MNQFNSAYAEATYAPEYNAIIVIWNQQVTDEAYKEAYNALLKILTKTKAKAVISDTFKQGIVSQGARQWLLEKIFPKAIEKGLEKVAIITSEDILKKLHTDKMRNYIMNYSSELDIQYFKSFNEALTWVKQE